MDKKKQYLKILNTYKKNIDFYSVSKKCLNETSQYNGDRLTIYETSVCVAAPALISYMLWVLKEAQKRDIKRLYFLARDGLIMYEISKILIQNYNFNIECRYLYCSRLSLINPIYIVDKEETINFYFKTDHKVTINVILKRMALKTNERKIILKELDIKNKDLNKPLDKQEIKILKNNLIKSKVSDKLLSDKSSKEYEDVLQYFREQGMFDETKYAIVDTGWIGTIQRCLRILLESHTENYLNLIGFYFGIIAPTNSKNGEYLSFYFKKKIIDRKIMFFNVELFECFCYANHGTTIGYKRSKEIIYPILKKHKKNSLSKLQFNTLIMYTKLFCIHNYYINLSIKNLDKFLSPIIKKFMLYPSYDEAKVYGRILSSEVPEDFVKKNLKAKIIEYFFIHRIYERLKIKKKYDYSESLWIMGSIALIDSKFLKRYLTINIWIYEFLRVTIKQFQRIKKI